MMKYNIKVWSREKYLPSKRHKNLRERFVENHVDVNVRELTKEQFPIAFIVHDYESVYEGAKSYYDFDGNGDFKMFEEEIRAYKGKLYKPVRITHGAAISTIFESLDYIKSRMEEYDPYWKGVNEFTENSIIIESNIKDCIKCVRAKAKRYIVFDGKVYEECGEPMYNVTTFGLGHNHGGTGFFIQYHYNENISSDNYFSALEREKAVSYGKNIATRRGDTNSVEGMGEHDIIEVLIPEMVKRNPKKDHEKGDSFMNSIESMIEGTESVTEAGLLTLIMAGSSMQNVG